jgi:hypothetical protein
MELFESGMSVSISRPLDALTMMAFFARKAANSLTTMRTVWEGTTERMIGLSLTAASREDVTSMVSGRRNPGR